MFLCFFGIYSQATETMGPTLSSEDGNDTNHKRTDFAKNVLQNRIDVAVMRHDGSPQALTLFEPHSFQRS
jgi:hypothetical protein